MRSTIAIVFGLLFASTVAASNCPNLIATIDNQLASAELDAETRESIRELRDEGESLHQQGKHDESIEVLEEALSSFPDQQ